MNWVWMFSSPEFLQLMEMEQRQTMAQGRKL